MTPRTLSRLFLAGAILIVLIVVTNVVSGQWAVQPPPVITTPPPPPTPGPEPTLVPDASTGKPITNSDEAIRSVLASEKFWAVREQPLTAEQLAAHPEQIVIEHYATLGEAADAYGTGHSPAIESEPVWVVIVKGKVHVTIIGLAGRDGPVEANGVTYIISVRTGKVIEVAAGILQKQK